MERFRSKSLQRPSFHPKTIICRKISNNYISLQLKFRGILGWCPDRMSFWPGRFFGLSCETIHHAGGVSPVCFLHS